MVKMPEFSISKKGYKANTKIQGPTYWIFIVDPRGSSSVVRAIVAKTVVNGSSPFSPA